MSECQRELITRHFLSRHCEVNCRLVESMNCMADGMVMMAINVTEQTATGPLLLKALSLISLTCHPWGLNV